MKKCLLFLSLVLILLNFNSCKNDLEAIAPYKESVAVYGMLDPTDTVNYIRVNRVFLGAGNAIDIAGIQDSVYFRPGEATVVIEKYWNGVLRQKYNFTETYEVPLQPGVFNINQLIYKSIQKFKSDSSGKFFDYVLKIVNTKTGTQFESEIMNVVKDISSLPSQSCGTLGANCFFSDPNSNITLSPFQNFAGATQTRVRFATPKYCKNVSAKMRFYYTEKYLNLTNVNKYFDYDLGDFKADNFLGGENVDFSFPGFAFYNSLNSSISSNDGVLERVADSMRFYFYFGGNELSLYQEINNTSGSFGQEKPIYTNMKNGAVGVFSSRIKVLVNKKVFRCGVSNQINVISESFLNFLRDSNYPYCRMLFRGGNCTQNTGC